MCNHLICVIVGSHKFSPIFAVNSKIARIDLATLLDKFIPINVFPTSNGKMGNSYVYLALRMSIQLCSVNALSFIIFSQHSCKS
jgi:hypothetical protein